MDLDIAQLRAFVACAECRHFGIAAARLYLTQQALSKRIERLERMLGCRLFDRSRRSAQLTESGRRLLPYARTLITTSANAAAAARTTSHPVRIDVWDHRQAPLRVLRLAMRERRPVDVDLSMRRSLLAALGALDRCEIEVAAGRVPDDGFRLLTTVSTTPVAIRRASLVVAKESPLARLRVAEKRHVAGRLVWIPCLLQDPTGRDSPEVLSWYRQVADRYDLALQPFYTADLDRYLTTVGADAQRVGFWASDWPPPVNSSVRLVPLLPAPCFTWSLMWRSDTCRDDVTGLVKSVTEVATARQLLAYDPADDWLPASDLERLRTRA